MQYGVARTLAHCLKQNGIDDVFFMTGGDQPFWIALKEAGLRLHLARSEASAVYMADGYSRATGRSAVVYGQWGPGAANTAAALADAWWARTPLIALTSAVPTSSAGRHEYQEVDQPSLFGPVTKWSAVLTQPDRVGELVTTAIRQARSGCPRPVHLDLPRNVLEADGDFARPSPVPTWTRPSATRADLDRVVEAMNRSKRPLLLAGAGVVISDGDAELARLATSAGIPVVTSMGGKGSISEDHPLAAGLVGRYSRKVANDILAEADFVLVLGSDLGSMVTRGYQLPIPEAVVAQIDIVAEVIGATRQVTIGIVADVSSAMGDLADLLSGSGMIDRHQAWTRGVQARIQEWKERFDRLAAEPPASESEMSVEAVVHGLRRHLGTDDMLVTDTGYAGAWAGALYPVRARRRFLRAAGSLGWSFPAALGARLGLPDSRVVCLTGDGGFGYHIGDIETALRLGANTVTVVLNNQMLAFEHHMQQYHYGNNIVPEVNNFVDVDYGAVATAFGALGIRVRTQSEFDAALKTALDDPRPAVLDVMTSIERPAPVTSYEAKLQRPL